MENTCVNCGKGCQEKRRPMLSLHLGTRKEKLPLCANCGRNRGSLNDERVALALQKRKWNQVDIDTATAQIRAIARKTKEGSIHIIRAA